MYLEHFGLRVNPFGISPRLDFLFRSGAFEEGMAHLMYGLENSEAIVMITGGIGTGKTMAVQSFLSYLGDRYLSALVTNTCVDGKELLKLILDDLDCAPPAHADKSDLLIAFKQFLIAAGRQGKRIIVVIDEAQNLSRAVLEEVRQLTNLGQGDQQPVQVILVGQPELEVAVNRPDLAQLRQRIRVHCRLAPLTRDELGEYVDHRMVVAGGKPGNFTKPALDAIYEFSAGVPRVVNTACDRALLAAFVAGRPRVEVDDVDADTGGEAVPAVPSPPVPRAESELPPAPAIVPVAAARPPKPAPPPPRAPRAPRSRHAPVHASRRAKMSKRPGPVIAVAVVVALAALIAWKWPLVRELVASAGPPRESTALPAHPAADERQPVRVPATYAEANSVAAAGDSAAADSSRIPAAVADTTVVRPSVPAPGGEEPPVLATTAGTAAGTAPSGREPVTAEPAARVVPATPGGAQPTEAGKAADGPCYLHVSSFRTPDLAQSATNSFMAAGQTAVVRELTVRDVLWYRVYLGPFKGHDEAVRTANELRNAGRITYYKVIWPGTGNEL